MNDNDDSPAFRPTPPRAASANVGSMVAAQILSCTSDTESVADSSSSSSYAVAHGRSRSRGVSAASPVPSQQDSAPVTADLSPTPSVSVSAPLTSTASTPPTAMQCPRCHAQFFAARSRDVLRRHLDTSCSGPSPVAGEIVCVDAAAAVISLRYCVTCERWFSTSVSHRCSGVAASGSASSQPHPPVIPNPAPVTPALLRSQPSLHQVPIPPLLPDVAPSAPATGPPSVPVSCPFSRRRGRVLDFVPVTVVASWVEKAWHVIGSAMQCQSDGDVRGCTNLLGLFCALPVLALAPYRRSRLHRDLPRLLQAIAVDSSRNVLQSVAAPIVPFAPAAVSGEPLDNNADRARAAACMSALQASGPAAAYRALTSLPLPPVTEQVVGSLRRMHPPAYPGRPIPVMPDCPVLDVNLARLEHAFRRLAAKASPGLSGWRKSLLTCLMQDPRCIGGIAFLVRLILNGSITDPALREALLGSRLIALAKPTGNGAVRPIAIGDIFVKLAAHYALDLVSAHIPHLFHPLQFGLYTRGGVEKVILAAQMLLESDPGRVMLSVDFQNSFNERCRAIIAEALYRLIQLSALWRLFNWSYGSPVPLFLFDRGRCVQCLMSCEGVRQGDVLGSFLFALSIQGPLRDVQAVFDDVRFLAVHDDVHLLGDPRRVFDAHRELVQRICSPPESLHQVDLRLACGKSQLFVPSPDDVDISMFDQMQLRIFLGGSFKLLGSYIGLDRAAVSASVSQHAQGILDTAQQALRNPFISVQLKQLLLRLCISSSFSFLARTVYPAQFEESALSFDNEVRCMFVQHCLGLPNSATFPQSARTQVFLPLRMGGMGLVSNYVLAACAFLSSAVLAHHAPIIPGFNDCPLDLVSVGADPHPSDWSRLATGFPQAVRSAFTTSRGALHNRDNLLPASLRELLSLPLPATERGDLSLQKLVTSYILALFSAEFQDAKVYPCGRHALPLVSTNPSSRSSDDDARFGGPLSPPVVADMLPHDRTLLRTRLGILSLPHAALPLTAWPVNEHLSLADPAMRTLLLLRLGWAPVPIPPAHCALCRTSVDFLRHPFHSFSCIHRQSGQNMRHTFLNRALCATASSCGALVSVEPCFLMPVDASVPPIQVDASHVLAQDDSPSDPASPRVLKPDAIFVGPGLSAIIDVSVVCSCAPSYVAQCAKRPTHMLCQRDREKRRKYTVLADHLKHTLYPVVFDALCVPGDEAVSMARDLAKVAVSSGLMLESSTPAFVLECLTRLAFSVALSNLTVMVRPCFGLIPTTGLPVHESDIPVIVVTPAVTSVSQHASAVSDAADVIVSVDYASEDVEWLDSIGGSDFLDSVLASALA